MWSSNNKNRLRFEWSKDVNEDSLSAKDLKQFTGVAKRKKQSKKPRQPRGESEMSMTWQKIIEAEIVVDGSNLVRRCQNNVVMFGIDKSIKILQDNSSQIFGDGTFRYAPKGYYQMYTFHIYKNNTYIPVLYFLLENKKNLHLQDNVWND